MREVGLLDFIDDYRPEFWTFVIVAILMFAISFSKGGGFTGSLIAGGMTGVIMSLVVHIAKRRLQR